MIVTKLYHVWKHFSSTSLKSGSQFSKKYKTKEEIIYKFCHNDRLRIRYRTSTVVVVSKSNDIFNTL